MAYVSGTGSGLASQEAAKKAADAAFFADLLRTEEKRAQALEEAQKAQQKPIVLTLGGNSVTVGNEDAKTLYAALSANSSLYETSPDQIFEIPGGGQASGREITAALTALILAGKV